MKSNYDIAHPQQGYEETVVEGTLTVKGKLMLNGDVEGLPQAENVEDSTATTVAALKEDFNTLLDALKEAGIMAADE